MRNRITFLALLLLSSVWLKAQQGEIIYTDYEPDPFLSLWSNINNMTIDLDGEGTPDIELYYTIGSIGMAIPYINSLDPDNLELCKVDTVCIVSNCEGWTSFLDWWIVYANNCYAFRYKHNDGYLYGWFETFVKEISAREKREVHWGVDRVAFCTIPNYPLIWGQTSLTGIEEKDKLSTFVTLHPNPTNGYVTILGENLQQAELFNMFGQQVLSVQGSGNEMQINVSALPVGIYFVAVTNEEGRRCVQKVVKE